MKDNVLSEAIAVPPKGEDKTTMSLGVRIPAKLHETLQRYAVAKGIDLSTAARSAMSAGVLALEAELAATLELESRTIELQNKHLVNEKLSISINQLHRKVERLEELLGELRNLPAVGAIADEISKLLEDV